MEKKFVFKQQSMLLTKLLWLAHKNGYNEKVLYDCDAATEY